MKNKVKKELALYLGIDTRDIEKTDEENEFDIDGNLIEVVSPKQAIDNELDFISLDELKLYINSQSIGMYTYFCKDYLFRWL